MAIRGFPGRIPTRDRRIRDNMDGTKPKLALLKINQAQRVETVFNRFACGHHGRNVLANKRNP
eukprot:8504686-Pyramimonas_sp.AAC.1